MSSALAGRLSTTEPTGKPPRLNLDFNLQTGWFRTSYSITLRPCFLTINMEIKRAPTSEAPRNIIALEQTQIVYTIDKSCMMFSKICYVKICIHVLGFLWHKCHKLGGLKQQKFILPHFWRQKSTIKVSAGLIPSGGCEGKSIPYLSPSFWWLLALLGIPRLVGTSLQLCLCLLMSFPFLWVCVQISLFI